MRIRSFLIYFVTFLIIGCSCVESSRKDLTYGIQSGLDYQHRRAVSISGMRLVYISELIQSKQTEIAIEQLDWYIDSMILEIAYAEKNCVTTPEKVNRELIKIVKKANPGNPIAPPELGLRKLAEYRKKYPRIHGEYLAEEDILLINKFIRKYTSPEVKKIIDKYFELNRSSITMPVHLTPDTEPIKK